MINNNDILHAANLLKAGKLIALPTETVYGLAADACNPLAIQKIYKIKNRPITNPLIIHLSDISAIEDFAINVPKIAYQLAEQFWPGPLTLVLPKHPNVLDSVTGGQASVALRIPSHPYALALLEAFGGGVAAPSANRSGCLSPSRPEHVKASLGLDVDYILDGGPCQVGIESTILSLLNPEPIILREGHYSADVLAKALDLPHIKTISAVTNTPSIPGSSLKHYAPKTALYVLEPKEFLEALNQCISNGRSCCVLSFIASKQKYYDDFVSEWIALENEPETYARNLYAALHQLDHYNAECILVEAPPSTTEWSAINDRLKRASFL